MQDESNSKAQSITGSNNLLITCKEVKENKALDIRQTTYAQILLSTTSLSGEE
jgi:hypothetical protein